MKKTLTMCVSMAVFGVLALVLSLFVPPPMNASAAVPLQVLQGSETKDFSSVADGDSASEDITVFGAVLGDYCVASLEVDSVDLAVYCAVTAANVATISVANHTGSGVDLASTTIRAMVLKRPSSGG